MRDKLIRNLAFITKDVVVENRLLQTWRQENFKIILKSFNTCDRNEFCDQCKGYMVIPWHDLIQKYSLWSHLWKFRDVNILKYWKYPVLSGFILSVSQFFFFSTARLVIIFLYFNFFIGKILVNAVLNYKLKLILNHFLLFFTFKLLSLHNSE